MAVAAIIAVLTWFLLRRNTAAPEVQDGDSTRREFAALRTELDELRASAVRVARDYRADRSDTPGGAGDRVTPSWEPAAVPAPHPEQHAPEPSEVATQIDSGFAAEPADPAWSQDATRRAADILTSTLPEGTRLGNLECHASLCRVESSHTSLEAFRSFVDVSFLSRDRKIWNGAFISMVVEISESGVKALSFIAREGKSIPEVQPIDG